MPFALSFWRLGGGLKVRSPLIRAKCVAPHEYSFMCRILDEADLGALAKLGRQLTGIGVCRESVSSYFASLRCVLRLVTKRDDRIDRAYVFGNLGRFEYPRRLF